MNLLHQADELARMVCKTAREYESHSEIVALAHKANHWLDCYHRQSPALISLAPEMAETLRKLVLLCPSSEGLGGHAPIAAFIQLGEAARAILARLPQKGGEK